MSALPQVDPASRVYSRTEEVVRPLHQHTKEQLSLKAQVIFEQCWRRLEEKWKDVSQMGQGEGAARPAGVACRGSGPAAPGYVLGVQAWEGPRQLCCQPLQVGTL